MPYAVHDFSAAARPTVVTTPNQYSALNGRGPRQGNGYANDAAATTASVALGLAFDRDTQLSGAPEPAASLLAGVLRVQPTQHGDYHFRLWVIPKTLSIVNPQLDTDIAFRLWNTFPDPETLSAVTVSGSSVLTFDVGPGTTFWDGEYRQANLQIGSGESSINAQVQFVTESATALLVVLADVADTFAVVPDAPITETWQFLTDVMTSHNGTEQRVSVRGTPRIRMSFGMVALDFADRLEQYELFMKNLRTQSVLPMFQYGAGITQPTLIGGSRLYFDPTVTNIRVGEPLVVLNERTGSKTIGNVVTIHADGATISSAMSEVVDAAWTVYPGLLCVVADGTGFDLDSVTGALKLNATSFEEPEVLRPGSSATLELLGGLAILDRWPLAGATELFQYRREVIDFDTGARDLNSRDPHVRVNGQRRFRIDRVTDPADMDYWRTFLDHVRGAFRPFLLSTFLPDMTLAVPFAQGAGTMTIREGNAPTLFHAFETYKRFEFEFEGGEVSRHTILSSTTAVDGTAVVSFTPPLPDDPAYVDPVRISYLQKVRMDDTVTFQHGHIRTTVTVEVTTTDDG